MKYKNQALEKIENLNNSVKSLISILNSNNPEQKRVNDSNIQFNIISELIEELQNLISIEQDNFQ
jgi:hypothetical protein